MREATRRCAGSGPRSERLEEEREVEGGRGVGQRSEGDEVDAGLGDLAEVGQRDPSARLESRPGRRRGRPSRAADRAACCRAGGAGRRPRAPRGPRARRGTRPRAGGPAASARAARTAAPTPPAIAAWFSLMRIASKRPKRWFVPPPAATAAFSSARRPGVVLRVSSTRAPVPSTSRTAIAVAVATPDSRWSRFSAVRSAVSSARAEPSTTSDVAALAPHALLHAPLEGDDGVELAERRLGDVEAEDHARAPSGRSPRGRARRPARWPGW